MLIGDNVSDTRHPLIFKAMEECVTWTLLSQAITQMLESIETHNYQEARVIMRQYVSGFTPDSVLVDWLSLSSVAEQKNDHIKNELFPSSGSVSKKILKV